MAASRWEFQGWVAWPRVACWCACLVLRWQRRWLARWRWAGGPRGRRRTPKIPSRCWLGGGGLRWFGGGTPRPPQTGLLYEYSVIVGQTHGRDPGFGAAVTCACRLAEAPGGLPPAWQSARQAAPQASGRRRTFSDPTNELVVSTVGTPSRPSRCSVRACPCGRNLFIFLSPGDFLSFFFLVLWVNDSATVFLGLSRARWMLPW